MNCSDNYMHSRTGTCLYKDVDDDGPNTVSTLSQGTCSRKILNFIFYCTIEFSTQLLFLCTCISYKWKSYIHVLYVQKHT